MTAKAPETQAVDADVPLDHPHQEPELNPPAIRIGTSCPGATTSGFLSGSLLGKIGLGQILPSLSPCELPVHIAPVRVTPPTQITSSTEPGDSTSPSSYWMSTAPLLMLIPLILPLYQFPLPFQSPSLPAAATTYTP